MTPERLMRDKDTDMQNNGALIGRKSCFGPLPSVCTTREAAEMLGVSLGSVQLWVDGGILKAWKTVGGHRRVLRESVNDLLRKRLGVDTKLSEVDGRKDDFYLAYQPILDSSGQVFGYELLCRLSDVGGLPKDGIAHFFEPLRVTSRMIRVAFGEMGFLSAIGDALCFINVEEEILDEKLLVALDPSRIVLELPANVVPTDALIERCLTMKRAGFRLLLDNYRPGESAECLLQISDFVKVNFGAELDALLLTKKIEKLSRRVKLIAGRLSTEDAFEEAKRLGYDYFQGAYFARPTVKRGRQFSAQRTMLLDLLRMLLAGDVDNQEIERRLKMEPALCFSLLKLVNSSAGALPCRIGTLREVLLLVGRQSLFRWILLLIYSNEEHLAEAPNPLMQAAAFRGRFLESLVALLPGQSALRDKAFMVGLLSHLEAFLGVPLEEVLRSLHLSADVERALLTRDGLLGELLVLVTALDEQDFGRANGLVERLVLDRGGVLRGMVESLRWGNALMREAGV